VNYTYNDNFLTSEWKNFSRAITASMNICAVPRLKAKEMLYSCKMLLSETSGILEAKHVLI
jgi:hypothetical protein